MRRSPKEGNMNESKSRKNKKKTHTLATEYIFILFYLFIADYPIKSNKKTIQNNITHTESPRIEEGKVSFF